MRAILVGLSTKPWLNSSKVAQHISQAWERVEAICSEESSLNCTKFVGKKFKILPNANSLLNTLEVGFKGERQSLTCAFLGGIGR
jgi:hypothetical protein